MNETPVTERTVSERRKKGLKQIGIGAAVLIIAAFAYDWGKESVSPVESFAECAAAGFPIMESYPRQCRSTDGRIFREDIGNELEKDNLIRISEPRPNAMITSPLNVTGMARGNWFFEASFPVKLLDSSGSEVGRGIATAKGEPARPGDAGRSGGWMTTEFVPFEATLKFVAPAAGTGILVLERDNPSGLPEHADELRIPVRFETAAVSPPTAKACRKSGCSGQICSDEDVITTCEYREEYACYKGARCERQANGVCGWTDTVELRACLEPAK